MSKCKSCKADIMWTRTDSGKAMPLDAEPEKRIVIAGATAKVVDTYTSHFATCPNAEAHRKGQKSLFEEGN